MTAGLTHVYYGGGKGKTTAAVGLAVRAAGAGKKVVVVQFLKQAPSGEVAVLKSLPNVTVLRGSAKGFVKDMTPEQLEETRRIQSENFAEALRLVDRGECDLLVLDEALDACQLGVLDRKVLLDFVAGKPEGLELVITGHRPDNAIVGCADYVTEMVKVKHPYDRGIPARKGVEF